MANAVLSNSFESRIHGWCAKENRVTNWHANTYWIQEMQRVPRKHSRFAKEHARWNEISDRLAISSRLNTHGTWMWIGCNSWNQIRMGEIQRFARFSMRKKNHMEIKGRVYKSSMRSAKFHGILLWFLDQNMIGILQWTDSSMVRIMCGVKISGKSITEVGLETAGQLGKDEGICWYGQ